MTVKVLVIDNKHIDRNLEDEYDSYRAVKTLCKLLSIIVNKKHFYNLKKVRVIDKNYREDGLILKFHYVDDIIDSEYIYKFYGNDIAEYYTR